eukprot:2442430-Rhodomonas_salina.3
MADKAKAGAGTSRLEMQRAELAKRREELAAKRAAADGGRLPLNVPRIHSPMLDADIGYATTRIVTSHSNEQPSLAPNGVGRW